MTEPTPQGALDTLWSETLAAWDDDKKHTALLDYALRTQTLPDLAGRYRSLLDDPERGALAKKRIDAIVIAATQMLMATKTTPQAKPPWQWTASAAILFVVVVGWLIMAMTGKRC